MPMYKHQMIFGESSEGMESLGIMRQHLDQALQQESQQPLLHLKFKMMDFTEVTANMRDSMAQVLRCLKVCYDAPPDCLFVGISTMDKFLAKMKVQPKHLACVAVSCFHLAMQISGNAHRVANVEDILNISQTQCTIADMSRMENIIMKKLDCDLAAITPLNFISAYCSVYDLKKPPNYPVLNIDNVLQKLEILVCNYQCAEFRSSVLALSLFNCVLEASYIAGGIHTGELMMFITSLQNFCTITDSELFSCRQVILSVLDCYNKQQQFPLSQKQHLTWKLSRRTLRQLKPTARVTSVLPTIEEADLMKLRNRHDSSDSDGMGYTSYEFFEMDEDDENCWGVLGL